jgi:hypothetical protein
MFKLKIQLSRGLTDGTYLGSAQDEAKFCPKGKT